MYICSCARRLVLWPLYPMQPLSIQPVVYICVCVQASCAKPTQPILCKEIGAGGMQSGTHRPANCPIPECHSLSGIPEFDWENTSINWSRQKNRSPFRASYIWHYILEQSITFTIVGMFPDLEVRFWIYHLEILEWCNISVQGARFLDLTMPRISHKHCNLFSVWFIQMVTCCQGLSFEERLKK